MTLKANRTTARTLFTGEVPEGGWGSRISEAAMVCKGVAQATLRVACGKCLRAGHHYPGGAVS